MATRFSTGLRNGMAVTSPIRTLLNNSVLKIYAGTVPSSADAALPGDATLLVTIVANDGNLRLDTVASGGTVTKDTTQIWSGVAVASGVATYYRHVLPSDTGVLSTTQVRIQGEVALVGKEMSLTNTSISSGATQTIDFYAINLGEVS